MADKEIYDVLIAASIAIRNGNRMYGLDSKITSDLAELDLSAVEAWQYLDHGLAEINPGHYCGKRPPDRAQDKRLSANHKGLELYKFEWDSLEFWPKAIFAVALKSEVRSKQVTGFEQWDSAKSQDRQRSQQVDLKFSQLLNQKVNFFQISLQVP